MDWPNSPTDHNRTVIEEIFGDDTSELERQPPSSGLESDEAPKKKVRYTDNFLFLLDTYTHIIFLANEP